MQTHVLKSLSKMLQQFGLNTAGDSPDHRKTLKKMQSQNNTMEIKNG